VIVRWGLRELPAVLDELRVARPVLIASKRWNGNDFGIRPAARWTEVPTDRIAEPAALAEDGVVAVGGGSAIDLGKAISAEVELPLVSVPTTYAGSEWTPFFGIRDRDRKLKGGGTGAHLRGAVYEPELTLTLPRRETVGTAMNALAHCAEAMYVEGHNAAGDAHAVQGASLIGEWLPQVVERPRDLQARTKLLEGAMHAGAALGASMLALGHAMAQALGGRYGLPHGAMNALCLPPAMRFNADTVPWALTAVPVGRVEELARLAGYERLRDLGVPEEELDDVGAAAAERPGARANPRPASAEQIAGLFRSIY